MPARVLDLSRLISRVGRRPTGVDRVELAYLKQFLTMPEPCFGLVRTALGYVLLDAGGMSRILDRIEGVAPWGPEDRLSKLARRHDNLRKRAESDLRRFSIARSRPMFLTRMLRRYLPKGVAYFNVGHSNLTDRVLWGMKHGPAARIAVFVHDTIPLDFPEFQRQGSVAKFKGFLRRVERDADAIFCNSEVTAKDIMRHLENPESAPETLVAHLGLDLDCSQNEDSLDVTLHKTPYFVCLGTIEPRKNHAFLFRLWEALSNELSTEEMPQLLVLGARGWRNEDVFSWLDTSPLVGRCVQELSGLSDGEVAALMVGSAGLVFPSLAEGFGLPPVEAAAMGIPVLSNDLPVIREILSDIPIYASVSDSYSWKKAIISLTGQKRARTVPDRTSYDHYRPPSWAAHFNTVLRVW